jgi:murein DD-endopeptidase MepM/ murein hydrolase activator NlpD
MMKKLVLFLVLGSSLSLGEMAFAAAPPKKVIAGPESTVYGIAYEHGIPTRALIAANNLKPPYTLLLGQALIIPSPNEHIVGQGETPQSIAEEYGVNVDVLVQENEASSVKQGERLAIPSRDTKSMTEALKTPSNNIVTSSLAPLPSVKSAPSTGKVGVLPKSTESSPTLPNELAEEIAREKGAPTGSPVNAKENSSSKPVLMGNLTQRNAGAPIGSVALQEEEVLEKPEKEIKKTDKKESGFVENKKKTKKETQTQDKESIAKKEETSTDTQQPQFVWPVEGKVISKFSPGKNDGIKVKVPEGTAVKAAAAGDVLYAGSELKGFGNLLLLKHKDGWVTAYAYNSSLLVNKGDAVKQGQVIAKSGKTGDAKEPQLHFEVRKGKQPVDPLTQLGS